MYAVAYTNNENCMDNNADPYSGVATIEATEAAKNAQQQARLSRPEFWHPKFSTQTLLDSITVPQ